MLSKNKIQIEGKVNNVVQCLEVFEETKNHQNKRIKSINAKQKLGNGNYA